MIKKKGTKKDLYKGMTDEERWEAELEMLTHACEETVQLELPDGSHIEVKKYLNVPEAEEAGLYQRQMMWAQERIKEALQAKREPDPADFLAEEEAGYHIIEIVTVNPEITVENLRKKPFKSVDAGVILMNYFLKQQADLFNLMSMLPKGPREKHPGEGE